MKSEDWIEVPIGINAQRWVTRKNLRTVLVVAHSATALQRLLDVIALFETDQRIQTVFTQGPGAFSAGVARLIEDLGGVVVPWAQAANTTFDLALASGYTSLHEIHAPVIVLPHGAGYNKFVPAGDSGTPRVRAIYGLNPQQLIRDGRVVPSVIAMSHEDDINALAENCPEAVSNAVVLGDPCLDRIALSRPHRSGFRNSLGLGQHEKLLVLSSTWGTESLFGAGADIYDRAMSEAAENNFRVAALLHPGIWSGHGVRQVRQWLRRHTAAGLLLVEPEEDWRAVLVSADWVISDHGSTCLYAAAAGAVLLRTDVPPDRIVSGSAMELLHGLTPPLRPDAPIHRQILDATAMRDESVTAKVLARSTSAPGRSAALTRRIIYQHLSLAEPPEDAAFLPVEAVRRVAP